MSQVEKTRMGCVIKYIQRPDVKTKSLNSKENSNEKID